MRYLKYITLLIFFAILSSCDEKPRCVAAEDFGQPKGIANIYGKDVGPKYDQAESLEYSFFEKSRSSATGYVLNGDDLKIKIRGAWSPWDESNLARGTCGVSDKVCSLAEDFTQIDIDDISGYRFKQFEDCGDGTSEARICWYPYGLGVYVGLGKNPSNSFEFLYHTADPKYLSSDGVSWFFTLPQNVLNNIKETLDLEQWRSIRIYLRVFDNNYSDNTNGCIDRDIDGELLLNPDAGEISVCTTPMEFTFMSGATREEPGFLENAARVFLDPASEMVRAIYEGFTQSPNYQNIYNLVWVLFITFYAIGYLLGFVNITHSALMVMSLRFALLYTFLSPNLGWYFFNDYVFSFFWYGSNELANLIINAFNKTVMSGLNVNTLAVGTTIDTSAIAFVDDTILMFVSEAINNKMQALIFSHELGVIYAIALYFAFFIFIVSMIELTVILIFIYLTMTILLALAPIFFAFAVFKYTREKYFESWLKAIAGAAIQPMIIFVFLTLFLTIITSFLYDMLYYEACPTTLINIPSILHLNFWEIKDIYDFDPITETATKTDKNAPNIDLVTIFILYLSTLVISHVTEMVPKVAEKISGGISLAAINGLVGQMGKTGRKFVEESIKTTIKSAHRRTTGRALSVAMDKAAPTFVSSKAHKLTGGLINKTKAGKMATAKKRAKANLRSKGYSESEMKDAVKAEAAKEYKKELLREKAENKKYGKDTINPAKIAIGAIREAIDNARIDAQKAQAKAAGKKFDDKKERKARDGLLKNEKEQLRNDDTFNQEVDRDVQKFQKEDEAQEKAQDLASDPSKGLEAADESGGGGEAGADGAMGGDVDVSTDGADAGGETSDGESASDKDGDDLDFEGGPDDDSDGDDSDGDEGDDDSDDGEGGDDDSNGDRDIASGGGGNDEDDDEKDEEENQQQAEDEEEEGGGEKKGMLTQALEAGAAAVGTVQETVNEGEKKE